MSNEPPRIPLKETANFGPLKAMAETNWEENNPKLVEALTKNGTFEQVLENKVGQAMLILQQTARPWGMLSRVVFPGEYSARCIEHPVGV